MLFNVHGWFFYIFIFGILFTKCYPTWIWGFKTFVFHFLPSYWCDNCKGQKKPKKKVNLEVNEKLGKIKEKDSNPIIESIHSIGEENGIEIHKQVCQSINSSIFDDNPNKGNIDFQDEDLYRDKDKKKDIFMLREVTKIYKDGKMACNKISFNLFRNEIFALLGRNGAGKTSLINGKFIYLIIF